MNTSCRSDLLRATEPFVLTERRDEFTYDALDDKYQLRTAHRELTMIDENNADTEHNDEDSDMVDDFVDKNGRLIRIKEGFDSSVEAQHNDLKVGRIDFDIDEDSGRTVLFGMEVDEAYQRSGIATAMMKMAVEIYGQNFGRPSKHSMGGKDARSQDYFTTEGAAFFNHCIRQGIVQDTEQRDDSDSDDF